MKLLVNVARFFVGILFIFSGLIKANDPRGLSYKMQEFFDVWGRDKSLTTFMNWLSEHALTISIIMITLEIIVGVGILLGNCKRSFNNLLLVLILFFTFLTGYAVLSGKIATCGCFGDCIPISAMQSFVKDLILLALILLIYFGSKHILPLFNDRNSIIILLLSSILILFFQWYVMRHNPVWDCLPYKVGNNIIELRKMPADATTDKKEYKFVYEKNGQKQDFTIKDLPDSTWTFVSREDVIIEKGKNNEAPIKDFYLNSLSGNDSTEAILNTDTEFYLFLVKNANKSHEDWANQFKEIHDHALKLNRRIYIVSPMSTEANDYFNVKNNFNIPVFSLDAIAFKTAARTNPALYLMKGPIIEKKWGWADFKDAVK
jgi:uncharacterized membrane protein YphA (DoxX/SURF4 family)